MNTYASGDGAQLNRLRWRCQRGMLELDHILGRFLKREYPAATAELREAFELLLALEDADILDFVVGNAVPPDDLADLVAVLRLRGDR